MDRVSLNVLVFRKVENDLELLTPESLEDEDEAVTAVFVPEMSIAA